MINLHDYETVKEMIEKIIEVDNNETLYNEIIEQPILNDDKVLSEQNFIDFMKQIIGQY
jgi:ABC-type phosphate/phosphonate transport system ATPase subunit